MTEERFCGAHKLFALDGTLVPHAASPMVQALRTGAPARDRTVVIERPDGTRVTVLVNIEPVFDDAGKLAGAVNCFQDITGLRRTHAALEAKERHLHALLDALPTAIYTTDAAGAVTFYNRAAVELVGYEPELGKAEWCVSLRLHWPDGRPMPHDECPMAVALREQRAIRGAEAIAERPDGTRVPFLAFPTPLYDERGRMTGAVNMLVDISERKEAEERQQLLIRELNHRVKNTLATVQAIAGQTLRGTRSPTDFVAGFSGRVQALARAHALLTHSTWRGAGVMDLVRDQLLLGGPDDDRIACSGPSLMLEPQPALHLALALHELGTNARRHGALSASGGRLAVSWKVQSNGGRNLLLHWVETDGPAVSAPAARGFGTSLVERSMEAHGGEATICYDADGVTCAIRLPLPELERTVSGPRDGPMPPTWADSSLAPPASGRAALAGKRILVIEDEPLVSMEIVASLEAAGYVVVGPAGTVEKARQFIDSGQFDAALLDANLAGSPVDEIAAALTRQEIPFAFVTGYGREALPRAFAGAPMLGKPFTDRELSVIVGKLVEPSVEIVRLRRGAG
jgi:PAS domain S-box-containing protein